MPKIRIVFVNGIISLDHGVNFDSIFLVSLTGKKFYIFND